MPISPRLSFSNCLYMTLVIRDILDYKGDANGIATVQMTWHKIDKAYLDCYNF